jgi:hypothetical protein
VIGNVVCKEMTESEQELAVRQFDELIKTLITLSVPPERQVEICGFGCPGDDMANDFDSYYTHCRKLYLDHGLVETKHVKLLDELDHYLDSRSGAQYAEFWENPDLLSSHPDWEEIRGLAHSCLVSLGKTHLDVEVSHVIENKTGPDGTPLKVQWTQLKLKDAGTTQPVI